MNKSASAGAMPRGRARASRLRRALVSTAALAVAAGLWAAAGLSGGGCQRTIHPPPTAKVMPGVGERVAGSFPDYMRGTVWEYTDKDNTGLFPVTSYGLVVRLRGTGDSFAPNPVRDWMIKEMYRQGFGRPSSLGDSAALTPEIVLADPSASIVLVGAYIPPGCRKGQRFDAQIQCLEGNNTTSLARGRLYRCDLRILGANPQNPGGSVNDWAKAEGDILVNPAYALNAPTLDGLAPVVPVMASNDPTGNAAHASSVAGGDTVSQAAVRESLRVGTIPNGAVAMRDRPLILRLRQPQWALSRNIEQRINLRFQDKTVAQAQDESQVHLFTPPEYINNWERFVNVANHLYMNGTQEYLNAMSQKLADEAVKPDAALQDIAYCWEGIGRSALPYIAPLLTNKSPDVAFAAAESASFIGDSAAQDVLMRMAATPNHPFRLNAVKVLGELPNSEAINSMLATLLDSPESDVRIGAYKVLAKHSDSRVWSKTIGERAGSAFMLDVIPTKGPPLVYASRVGEPRIAIFAPMDAQGHPQLSLRLPVTFTAFDNRLSITSQMEHPRIVTIFYRGEGRQSPQPVLSTPDVPELIARLGGEGVERSFRFGYGDVVAVLQALSQTHKMPAQFVLEQTPTMPGGEESAPVIPDPAGRPQSGPQVSVPPSSPPTPQPAPNLIVPPPPAIPQISQTGIGRPQ